MEVHNAISMQNKNSNADFHDDSDFRRLIS